MDCAAALRKHKRERNGDKRASSPGKSPEPDMSPVSSLGEKGEGGHLHTETAKHKERPLAPQIWRACDTMCPIVIPNHSSLSYYTHMAPSTSQYLSIIRHLADKCSSILRRSSSKDYCVNANVPTFASRGKDITFSIFCVTLLYASSNESHILTFAKTKGGNRMSGMLYTWHTGIRSLPLWC